MSKHNVLLHSCLRNLKSLFIYIPLVLLYSVPSHAQQRSFGPLGLKGLSSEQLAALAKGEIVFISSDPAKAAGTRSLIEAAIVFSTSPATAWKLISKTDDQPKYIDKCKDIKVISKLPGSAQEVHSVGNMLITYTYGVMEHYLPDSMSLFWTLDTSYVKNDVTALTGYWQLYPYGNGKTLARYGSNVSFKNMPAFLENMFKKGGVKDALGSVKEYVDSGGTYHK